MAFAGATFELMSAGAEADAQATGVVGTQGLDGSFRAHGSAGAGLWMPFAVGQQASFEENRIGNADLADIVQISAAIESELILA